MRIAAAPTPSRRLTSPMLATASVLVLFGTAIGLAPEVHASTPDLTRIAGEDRFETAADAAARTNPDGADAVIVAAGFNFPDSLAAAGLSGLADAPILLVNDDAGTVPAATSGALAELAPETLYIAGGPGAISDTIIAELEAEDWELERLSGADRFATAALMAEEFTPDDVADATAIVATGRTAADALSVGPLAAGGPHPVLLTKAEELPEATETALDDLAIDQVLVLGGETAVSDDVVDDIEDLTGSGSVTRLAGRDRFATAVAIAEASDDLAASNEILIATGYGAPNPDGAYVPADALVAGLYGGQTTSPLLPINDVRDELPEAIRDYTAGKALQIRTVTVFGGSSAISDALADEVTAAATPDVEGPAVLFDDPVTFTDELDEPVTVTVTALDDEAAPIAGQDIDLARDRVLDDGTTDADGATVTTDAAGRASWSVDAADEIAEDTITASATTELGELTAEARVAWSDAGVDNRDADGDGLLAYATDALLARDGWSEDPVNDAIAAADDSDTLAVLGTHDYLGGSAIAVDRPVALTGDATIHGHGFSVIRITSPGVTLQGLTVHAYAEGVPHAVLVELDAQDAGIVIDGLTVQGHAAGDSSGITVTSDGGELSGVTIRDSASTDFATPVFVTGIHPLPREPMTSFDIVGGPISDVVIEDNVLTGGGQAILAGLFDEDGQDTPDVTVTGNTLTPDSRMPESTGLFLNGRVDPDQITDNVFQGASGLHAAIRGSADDAAAEQLARDLVPRNTFLATDVFHFQRLAGGDIEGWVVGTEP